MRSCSRKKYHKWLNSWKLQLNVASSNINSLKKEYSKLSRILAKNHLKLPKDSKKSIHLLPEANKKFSIAYYQLIEVSTKLKENRGIIRKLNKERNYEKTDSFYIDSWYDEESRIEFEQYIRDEHPVTQATWDQSRSVAWANGPGYVEYPAHLAFSTWMKLKGEIYE